MTGKELLPMLTVLLILVFSDLHSRHVPLPVVGIGFAVRSVLFFTEGSGTASLFAALLKGVPMLAAMLFTVLVFDRLFGKKTLGGGDVWFLTLLAFSFPLRTVLPAILSGLVLGLLALIGGRIRKRKKYRIPLTPYLMIGLEAAILFSR